jgi:archaeosine-15-forming tRNA-guanine transglycosylase
MILKKRLKKCMEKKHENSREIWAYKEPLATLRSSHKSDIFSLGLEGAKACPLLVSSC